MRMDMEHLFDQPRPLITADIYGMIQVDHETLERIQLLQEKLVVVGIVGLYRTGKSYIMNRLAGKSSGFALGSTIDSHTKGIWIWGRQLPGSQDKYMLLLDTEGMGDVSKGDATHDATLLTLTTLLSSVLIYNIMGPISGDEIAKLNLVTDLSRAMTSDNSKPDASNQQLVPELLVVLRDFYLELDISGETITSDQYLEDCLQVKPTTRSKDSDASQFIMRHFVDRRCFTLDRPVETARKLKKLDGLSEDELSDDFLEDSTVLCDHIYRVGRVKRNAFGNPMSGEDWCEMTEFHVLQIQNGRIPHIGQVITSSEEAVNIGMAAYKTHLDLCKISLPLPNLELNKQRSQGEIIAVQAFKAVCVADHAGRHEKNLREMMRMYFREHILDQNSKISHDLWSQYLASIVSSASFATNIEAGIYVRIGGYRDYSANLDRIKTQYNECKDMTFGDKKERALSDFLIEHVPYEKAIMDLENELNRFTADDKGINVAAEYNGFSTVPKIIFIDSKYGCQIKSVEAEISAGTRFCRLCSSGPASYLRTWKCCCQETKFRKLYDSPRASIVLITGWRGKCSCCRVYADLNGGLFNQFHYKRIMKHTLEND